jgi:hypothetical protein
MQAVDYVRGRMAALLGGMLAAAATPTLIERPSVSYPQTRQRHDPRWKRTHGFSGAKLARRAAAGTVGLARLK